MTDEALSFALAYLLACLAMLAWLVAVAFRTVRRALQDRRTRIEAMRAALGPLPDDEPGREVYP